MSIKHSDLGWQNLRAGISLVNWSKLAKWDADTLKLIANEDKSLATYEGFKDVHNEYGRLICWITFSVGAEYIVKGYFISVKKMKGLTITDERGKDIDDNYIIRSQFFALIKYIEYFIEQGPECDQIKDSLHHLRKFIRNRDMHSYEKDVRGSNLHLVKNKFIPAFNFMFASLDQSELELYLADIK